MKKFYLLYRTTSMADVKWQYVTSVEAVNIIDAEDHFEEYIMPEHVYIIVRDGDQ